MGCPFLTSCCCCVCNCNCISPVAAAGSAIAKIASEPLEFERCSIWRSFFILCVIWIDHARSVSVSTALGRCAHVHLQVHLGVLLQVALRLTSLVLHSVTTGGLVSQPAFKSDALLHYQSAKFTLMSSCGSVMQVRSVELHVARAVPIVADDGRLI